MMPTPIRNVTSPIAMQVFAILSSFSLIATYATMPPINPNRKDTRYQMVDGRS